MSVVWLRRTVSMAQKKISCFFTPKRQLDSSETESPETKRLKCTDGETLSPDVRARMNHNKLLAKIKQQSNKTSALSPNIGPSWFAALEPEFSKPYFMKLSKFLENEKLRHTVYPPADQVYSWTRSFPIKEVKVVILGQDPYHNVNQAHGLCFSVQKGVALPPSLVNIYKELESDIENFKPPGHGCLEGWSEQGVLLLNACLSVRAHNANSHQNQGWEQFTDAVIKWINEHLHGIVFLLWGSFAQKKGSCINKKKHHVLMCAHPSPLSAHRGFLGCKHFSKTNELLKAENKPPIDWSHLP